MKPTSPPSEWFSRKWSTNLLADPRTGGSVPCSYGRAIPVTAIGETPPGLIIGRQIRGTIPTMAEVSKPKLPDHAAVKKADVKAKKRYKESFDRGNGTRELPALQPGDWVRVKLDSEKQCTTESKVISTDQSPRSYIVDSGGRMLRRNRKHLIKVSTPTCHDTPKDNFRFQKSVSLLPKMSKQRIPKFRKTATPVLRAIITQSRNRGPPVED